MLPNSSYYALGSIVTSEVGSVRGIRFVQSGSFGVSEQLIFIQFGALGLSVQFRFIQFGDEGLRVQFIFGQFVAFGFNVQLVYTTGVAGFFYGFDGQKKSKMPSSRPATISSIPVNLF